MWEKIKSHPWIVGGAVGLLLLVLVFSSSGGSSVAATSEATAGPADNGDQVAAYMAQLNLQGRLGELSAGVESEKVAGAITLGQINASSNDLANQLAAQVAIFTTGKAAETQQHSDTLNAQTQQAIIGAGVTNTQTVANSLIQQATISADVAKSISNQNTQVYLANINANKEIQTQSWLDKIF